MLVQAAVALTQRSLNCQRHCCLSCWSQYCQIFSRTQAQAKENRFSENFTLGWFRVKGTELGFGRNFFRYVYSSDEIRFCLIQETRLGFVWLVSVTCLLAVHGWLYLTHSGPRRPPVLKNWFQENLTTGCHLPTCSTYLLNNTYLLTHSPRTNLKLVFLKKMAQIKTILLFNKSTSTSCAPGWSEPASR